MKNIKVIRSPRKTISLEIGRDLSITVRAPYRVPDKEIEKFVVSKKNWIDEHKEKMRRRIEESEKEKFSEEELDSLFKQAKDFLPDRVSYFAKLIGVSYGRITVRSQVSRWGSCSAKHNLNFNCLLALCPEEIADYVIVHELCHIKEMNHSERFWREVEKYIPDYKARNKWLKDNGMGLIDRLR